MKLVFIHGFLGASLNWSRVSSSLSAKVSPLPELSSVDLLWHSRGNRINPKNSNLSLLDLMTNDLAKQFPKPPFSVVAHSFGIRPLLKYMSQFPDHLESVIIEDSSPVLSQAGYKMLKSILTELPESFKSREDAKNHLDLVYGKGVFSRFLLSNISRSDGSSVNWRFDSTSLLMLLEESRSDELWDEWSSYPGKIHLILGADSETVSPDTLMKAKQLRASSSLLEVITIAQSGHWVHYDQLDQFTDCVSTIINS